ncbi:MAG: flagellar motor switch protein FliM [Gemmatimonadetes bacterium]|jgi:flagellar motor switch protein FliM|nr:flagellar motor switch protein FliM [Gemmatimonadota bacterium]MBT7862340.1 flagellar motor switch protein FliM [Gemmatimonadota bacterium]
MADILSQDEIDVLLSKDELKALSQLLHGKGLDTKQIANFHRQIQGIGKNAEDRQQAIVAGLEAAAALPGQSLQVEEQNRLENEVSHVVEVWMAKKHEQQPPKRQRIVTSYDFKHPARVNKDQLRTLENLHDNFARLLSSTLSGAMRAVVDVDTAFVDQTTYAEFIMSLSNPSCSYQFTLGPTNGQVIMDFAMPIVFGTVDRIFGGKGSSQGVDARQLSQVEMGVIAKVVKRAVEDLEATWEPILPVEIYDIELETNPEFMQITAASEIVILLAFEVNSTNMSGLISLCYPFFTLESILPRLGQQTYVRQGRSNREETRAANAERLANTPVPLRAEFARGKISIDAARHVQVGDVIEMDTPCDEPAVVFVDDEPKFLGLPFTNEHGRTTVKVAEVISPSKEEIHKNRSRPITYLDTQ